MSNRTGSVVLHNIDCEVAELIAEKLNVDNMKALELFLDSETLFMLLVIPQSPSRWKVTYW